MDDLVTAFKDAGCSVKEMNTSDFHYWQSNVSQHALGKQADRPYIAPMCHVKFEKDNQETNMYYKNDFV